jgi:hypothetical protein
VVDRLDGTVERASRWAAARSTRRGFLGRLGRAGVLVAGGPAMAVMLSRAEVAEARVCGQTGVAPKCPTFDCSETIGWCWYATGCCAEGRLKKICDCCAPNTPYPVGYCPSGTRVLCIWESCGADPRLQTRTIHRWRDTDPTTLSVHVSRTRFPASAPMAALGDAESPAFAGIASALGSIIDGPVLLSARHGLSEAVAGELERLGVEFVKVVGSHLSPAIDAALAARGLWVERIGLDPGIEGFSAEVSGWSRPMTGNRTGLVIVPGPAERALPAAAAVANARRWPLLVGTGAAVHQALIDPRPVRTTWVLTHDPAIAAEFPGGRAVTGGDLAALSTGIADVGVLEAGVSPETITLAPVNDDLAAAGLATMPGPQVRYQPGTLDGARDWLFTHRARIQTAHVAGVESDFADPPYYELQSILNRYETHLLTGSAGEGLPVIPQPRSERPIGQARE